MREQYRYEQLECVLTDEELKAYSKIMAEGIRKRECAKDELKAFQSQRKSEIDGCDAVVNDMAGKVGSGKEYRRVKCIIIYNWEDKEKEIVREDTGEFICKEIITEHELQEEAELNAPEKESDK